MHFLERADRENVFFYIIGIVISYLIIMFFIFNIDGATIAKFMFLNIFSVLLPGLALMSLLKIKQSKVGVFSTAYILGYALLVVEYFVLRRTSGFSPFCLMGVVVFLSLLIMGYQYRSIGKFIVCDKANKTNIEIFFFALIIIVNVFVYAGNFLGPDVVSVFKIHRDMQYWINNSVALKLSWPPENLFMDGDLLTYHYFSGIPIAFLSGLYGIDIFTLSIPLYALTKAIVMFGSVQFLCRVLRVNSKWTIVAYLLMLFSTGYEKFSIVTIFHHLLYMPFGFDIGYAYAIMFVSFLLLQWRNNDFDYRLWFGMLLMWIMSVGAKAPIAAVMMIFAGYVCCYWLYQKKFFQSLGYGLTILFVFWLIGKYCVGMFSTMNGDSAWSLGLYSLNNNKLMNHKVSQLIVHTLGVGGKYLVFVMGGIVFVMGGILRTITLHFGIVVGWIMSIFLTARLIQHKKLSTEEINLRIALLLASLCGLGMWHIINAGGSSEMYFAMAALIPLSVQIMLAAKNYEHLRMECNVDTFIPNERAWRKYFTFFLSVSVILFAISSYDGSGVIRQTFGAIRNYYHLENTYGYEIQKDGIRRDDVAALYWLRDHSEKDAVIMSDKAVIEGNKSYYYYGIFSERQQYMEGTDMLGNKRAKVNDAIRHRKELIYDVYNNIPGAIARAKSEGVDYIVQTVDVTPWFMADERLLECVTSSSTINVYKIK